MADVKICDRCGKKIEADNIFKKVGFGAWRYSIFCPDVSTKSYYDYDLCSDCGDKLAKFFNGADIKED